MNQQETYLLEVNLLKNRIKELESLLFLKNNKIRAERVYPKFNINSELERISFYVKRDGLLSAEIKTKELIRTYLDASLKSRQKFNTKSYPYRFGYVESVYSLRMFRKLFLGMHVKASNCETISRELVKFV